MEPNEQAVIEAIDMISKKKEKTSMELICDVILKERGLSKEETKNIVKRMHSKNILTITQYGNG